MMREEVALFESGGMLDFHYGPYNEFAFEPAKVDTVLRDEEVIKVGDISITALHTPGHTKGSTTYVTKIVSDGETYTVVFPKANGLGVLRHRREFAAIDQRDVVRMNRDTLYSSGVFDLDVGPVTITLPDTGKRYMALLVINQDHYAIDIDYAPGTYTYTKDKVGTRYVFPIVRTLAIPGDPADVKAANDLRDAIKVEQAVIGKWEAPHWDDKSRTEIRDALAILGRHQSIGSGKMFGTKAEVDPVQHLIGTAIGWGGNPPSAAVYSSFYPPQNDGNTA